MCSIKKKLSRLVKSPMVWVTSGLAVITARKHPLLNRLIYLTLIKLPLHTSFHRVPAAGNCETEFRFATAHHVRQPQRVVGRSPGNGPE